jgi:hypothetical protein
MWIQALPNIRFTISRCHSLSMKMYSVMWLVAL